MSQPYESLNLEPSTTVDRVATELRRAIFDGELESGTPLREVALADSLGVARSTVREALTALVADGLAVREPHRGVSVASPDPDSIRDICRARSVLEAAGMSRWREASETARERVRAALTAYTDSVAADAGYERLNELHLALHCAFVGLLDNDRLLAAAESLSAELRLSLAQVERLRRNAHDQADSHASLVALLEQDRIDDAVAAITAHLAAAEESILEALDL